MERISVGISEMDRVLGGGLLAGSLVLLGGNPGIGKSTLALQILPAFEQSVLYVSAEESEDQIGLRAKRLGVNSKWLYLSSENRIGGILDQVSIIQPQLSSIGQTKRNRHSHYWPCDKRGGHCGAENDGTYGGYCSLFRRG